MLCMQVTLHVAYVHAANAQCCSVATYSNGLQMTSYEFHSKIQHHLPARLES